jgi:hypothetical protein
MSDVYTLNFKDKVKKSIDDEQTEGGKVILSGILGMILGPLFLWVAWNLCIPALFGLPAIGYIKSLALYTLVKVLK